MYSIFSPVKARGMGADPACKVACNIVERRAPGARAGGPGRGWEAVNALNVSLWIRAWWQRCSPRHSRRHAQSNFCTCHGLRTKRFSSRACVCVSRCGNGRMSHRDRHRREHGYLAPAPHLSASIPRGLKISSLQSCAQGVQDEAAGPSDNPQNRLWNNIKNLFSLLTMHCAISSLIDTAQTIWVLFIFRIKLWGGGKEGEREGCFNYQDPIKHLSHSWPQPLPSGPIERHPGLHPAKL